jgi:hypothetical protein
MVLVVVTVVANAEESDVPVRNQLRHVEWRESELRKC